MGRKESKIQRWASHSLGIIFFALSSQFLISSSIDQHQERFEDIALKIWDYACLLYTSPSPRDSDTSRMPSSA